MPIVSSTDFIMYSSVYEPVVNGYGSEQITAINNAATIEDTTANIGGIGQDFTLGLRYTTSNLGIPLNATILGFDIKVQNRVNSSGQSLKNLFLTNTLVPENGNNPFGSLTGVILQTIDSTNNLVRNYGYAFNGQTGLRSDELQTVPLIDLIANDNLCLFMLTTETTPGVSSFGSFFYNKDNPSIGLKIHYSTPDFNKTTIGGGLETIETDFQFFQEASPGNTVIGDPSEFTQDQANILLPSQFGGVSTLIRWDNNSASDVASYISLSSSFNDIDPIPDNAENIKLTLYYAGLREAAGGGTHRLTFRFVSPNEGSFNVFSEVLTNTFTQFYQEITDLSLTPAFVNDPDLELQIHLSNNYIDSSGNNANIIEENGTNASLYGFENNVINYDPKIKITYDIPVLTKVKLGPESSLVSIPITKASTSTGTGNVLNANVLASGQTGTAVFNQTHNNTDSFTLSDFGFNIPSNAVINNITTKVSARRISGVGNGLSQLVYVFDDDNGATYTKLSNTFGTNFGFFNNMIQTFNNPILTPNFINNLRWKIFWRNDLADDDTGAFGQTNDLSTTGVDLNGSENAFSGFFPGIEVNYSIPQIKFRLQ